MALNLTNTEIAFHSRSDRELRRSYWLFRIMDFPRLVKIGTRLVRLLLWLHLPIEWLIRRTIFKQFVGGETVEACEATIETLAHYHIGTILDYSVEGNGTEAAFDHSRDEILRTVRLAAGNPKVPFCVFKVTGVARFGLLARMDAGVALTSAERQEWERAKARVVAIGQAACDNRVRLLVDAEESWVQQTIDALTWEMMERFNREMPLVYNTLQMYRTDRLEILRRAFATAESKDYFLGLKLVRGAYMEKERERAGNLGAPSPILPDKASVDRDYDAALDFCVQHLERIALCAGTHNEASTRRLAALMESRGLSPKDERIFFAQLLGMSDHLSYNLAASGYNVAKYVPYGPVRAVMPYLFRRAEENTAIGGQSNRELSLIREELNRRKGRKPAVSTLRALEHR